MAASPRRSARLVLRASRAAFWLLKARVTAAPCCCRLVAACFSALISTSISEACRCSSCTCLACTQELAVTTVVTTVVATVVITVVTTGGDYGGDYNGAFVPTSATCAMLRNSQSISAALRNYFHEDERICICSAAKPHYIPYELCFLCFLVQLGLHHSQVSLSFLFCVLVRYTMCKHVMLCLLLRTSLLGDLRLAPHIPSPGWHVFQ